MAEHWRIQWFADPSFMVLWVIMTIASGVDCSPASSSSGIETPVFLSDVDRGVYYKLKRDVDEESLEPPTSDENAELDSTQQDSFETQLDDEKGNSGSIVSEEYTKDSDLQEEPKKSKSNNKQKYLGNDFKNYSSSKTTVDAKHITTNESINDKDTLGLYGSQGHGLKQSNFNKKDTNYSDYSLKTSNSNLTVQNPNTIENKKNKLNLEIDSEELNEKPLFEARLNETEVMNDQPAESSSEMSQNNTDLSDEDTLDFISQNATDRFEDHNTTNADGRTMPASEGLDFLAISGIILGTVVLLGLMAGGGFVVYRHRMWNKPQTLSDKCSNADSNGYIDDSTLRENSEEMYSLDNDSFLNSLEAMTIQNYWTDNVKHTKL